MQDVIKHKLSLWDIMFQQDENRIKTFILNYQDAIKLWGWLRLNNVKSSSIETGTLYYHITIWV